MLNFKDSAKLEGKKTCIVTSLTGVLADYISKGIIHRDTKPQFRIYPHVVEFLRLQTPLVNRLFVIEHFGFYSPMRYFEALLTEMGFDLSDTTLLVNFKWHTNKMQFKEKLLTESILPNYKVWFALDSNLAAIKMFEKYSILNFHINNTPDAVI